MGEDIQKHSVHTLVFRSLKRTHDMFLSEEGSLPPLDSKAVAAWKSSKAKDTYGPIVEFVKKQQDLIKKTGLPTNYPGATLAITKKPDQDGEQSQALALMPSTPSGHQLPQSANISAVGIPGYAAGGPSNNTTQSLVTRKAPTMPKPQWHPPWKLYRVISGHIGWVRCVAVDPTNEWFCTGSADRVIKIWDLASGKLKLSLTGHVSTVRALQVSPRHPYLFSAGEDRQVKCWDLEYNKVIRHYHGHLSAVYSMALHPTIDVLVTCGRDSTARVWDMRTKANIHTLTGHTNTVASVVCQAAEPQIITSSHDNTIRLWDLAAGKSMATLTNHKKSVRAVVLHPSLYMFASASPDNIKQWKCPEGKFIQNLSGHNAILNCLAVNADNVLVSGADNGSLHFWDFKTGYNFQRTQAPVQPGSMDSEAGVFAMAFDNSGSRLITAEADKTIKIYKEDDEATEETHPINWKPDLLKRRRY
uniref:Pleiotropic regulator 1 n=1 Tax=Megafenestra aurita TaxID=2291010 RepID=A0A4Y7NI44_9CRUS|nr:EOG090X03RP [Megafenestra aurita]SVE92304.1 EOG090X03RP [Megafenestra aurita]